MEETLVAKGLKKDFHPFAKTKLGQRRRKHSCQYHLCRSILVCGGKNV